MDGALDPFAAVAADITWRGRSLSAGAAAGRESAIGVPIRIVDELIANPRVFFPLAFLLPANASRLEEIEGFCRDGSKNRNCCVGD